MEDNKTIVRNVLKRSFIDRDPTVVAQYFAPDYVQHNPTIATGAKPIPGLISSLPATFRYEPGMAVAEGDLVMVHGRYTGWAPKPVIAVDIFRVVNGRVVEHWDVIQDEVPADQTASGNPMFSPQEAG